MPPCEPGLAITGAHQGITLREHLQRLFHRRGYACSRLWLGGIGVEAQPPSHDAAGQRPFAHKVESGDLLVEQRAVRTEEVPVGDSSISEDPGQLVFGINERDEVVGLGKTARGPYVSVSGDGDKAGVPRSNACPLALPDRQLLATHSPRGPDQEDQRIGEQVPKMRDPAVERLQRHRQRRSSSGDPLRAESYAAHPASLGPA